MNPTKRNPTKRSPIAPLVALVIPLGGLAQADVIILADGRELTPVTVSAATHEKVQYEMDGRAQSIDSARIDSIVRESRALQGARRLFDAGNWAEAYKEFKRVADGPDGWEKAEAMYAIGSTYLRSGPSNATRARDAFKDYLDKYKDAKDWWVPFAIYGTAQASLDSGQGATAAKFFGDLSAFGPLWDLKGTIGEGEAKLALKDYFGARTAFSKVTGSATAPLALKHAAAAGRAAVLVAQENWDAALDEIDGAFFRASSQVVYDRARARATLLKGECHLGKGGKENLERAEIWFLKVTGLYGSYADEARRAARGLVLVYRGLGNEERAREWQKQAGTES